MAKQARKPFEVRLKGTTIEELGMDLARSLDDALSARSMRDSEVEYAHTLYEQGRTRTGRNSPWVDAADLTSYLGTQYVDVLRAQIVRTVMTEPVWMVEGYGDAEKKAPFVEEFHQWQLEAEGFQSCFGRTVHLALIEPFGVMEVYEETIRRPVRKTITAALQLAPDGSVLVGEDLKPLLQQDEQGKYLEVTEPPPMMPGMPPMPPPPSAEVEIDSLEVVCRGPRERTIAYRDFLVLPGHARDKSEIWGYAKRFYRRVEELRERVKAGLYDKEAVADLGTDDERASDTTLAGTPIGIAAKDGTDRVDKELWEVLFLRDLDGKGARWFVATLSKDKQRIVRLQYDDIGRPRFFLLVPFPRPNSVEGYSYIGHKLITVIEEHTALRNLRADDSSMQLQLPILRKQGALWDPETEPMGPKSVIPVREPTELQFMQRQNNTGIAVEWIRDIERAGERLSGINDASAGFSSEDQRTLGEVRLISQQSQGRSSEVIKNIQETVEEIAQVRHLMWKRALAEMGAEGLQAPPSVLQGLEFRGADVLNYMPNNRFTAQMLEGAFRFKPRGSVDNADPQAQQFNWNQFLQGMSQAAAINPMILAILQTPQAAKAMIEQGVRLYDVPDKQAFLGSEAMMAAQQAMEAMQMQQMAAVMGAPAPPGGPGRATSPLGVQAA